MDVESLGDISVSSSVERQAMREQLDAVRQTLNSLASGAQPGGSGMTSVTPTGFEAVLTEIASKLSSIEGLYTNLTSKLEKVDLRVEDSERHIKDLQHFSASTIHETARLVDYVGGRATPNTRAGSLAGATPTAGPGSTTALRARHMAAAAGGVPSTPPHATVSPVRTPVAALEYVPGHMTATIQQHAAQIHKLIAGLDFLEAHIIRQDQAVEALQKSVATAAGPSELSLRMHDMAELLNKLRAHMYKVEKKAGSTDQVMASLAERVQAVELAAAGAAAAGGSSGGGAAPSSSGPGVVELAAAQEELRSMVVDLGRDVEQLRDQVTAAQPPQEPASGVSAEEAADMRRQLAYLMSQFSTLLMENAELRQAGERTAKQVAELAELQQHQQREAAAAAAAAAAAPTASAPTATSEVERTERLTDQVASLSAAVAGLQEQVAGLEGRLSGVPSGDQVRQVAEEAAAAAVEAEGFASASTAGEVEGLAAAVAALRERVDGLDEKMVGLDQQVAELGERVETHGSLPEAQTTPVTAGTCALPEDAEDGSPLPTALAVVEAVGARRESEEAAPVPPTAKFVGPVPVDDPAAAVLAAEVAAAARANLEEQFGQMRHRLELAADSVAAAEEAARRSAEAAGAAAAAADAALATVAAAEEREAQGSRGAAAVAELQENVMAMVAGLEQEQAALKQQLAQLAAQVSGDQAAISAGLQQVQEQVAAAAAAATEAAACAQLVGEQQAAAERQERQAAEALAAVQAELKEQVAGVMEQLKQRVELGMQQMDSQVAALGEQLGGAIRADQLDAAMQELRAAVADTAERYDISSASMDELRSELILLTGQHDVVLSRLSALEAAVGLDPRVGASLAGGLGALEAVAAGLDAAAAASVTAAAEPPQRLLDDAEEAEDGDVTAEEDEDVGATEPEAEAEAAAVAAVSRALGAGVVPSVAALSRAVPEAGAGRSGGAGGGLLELVAELRARVSGLEGLVEAAAADIEQVRSQVQDSAQEVEGKIQQATAQLLTDLEGLSAAVEDMDGRVAGAAAGCEELVAAQQRQAAEQEEAVGDVSGRLEELQMRLEMEVVTRVQETSAAVSEISARLARDYINREQLGAIFQARADMKRAVDELATVFDTGRLLRTVSVEDASTAADGPSGSGASGSGALSPRLVSALEDLAGKQAELEHQVKLALYRTEGAVRQEELRGLQQAMMTLEMQFRKLGAGPSPPATAAAEAAAAPAAAGEVEELRARVEALEAALAAGAAAAQPPPPPDTVAPAGDAAAEADTVDGVRLRVAPEDPDNVDSPIRVQLLVGWRGLADDEEPDSPGAGGGPSEEAAAEPSLSQMLHHGGAGAGAVTTGTGTASSASSPDRAPGAAAAEEQAAVSLGPLQAEVQELRRVVADLARLGEGLQHEVLGEAAQRLRLAEAVAEEAAERQRLAEAVAELQERLDSQVNATASTAAMLATMATDQHAAQQQVRLTLRVGGPEAEDLASLAAAMSTLTARVDAAEDALASAFVVRTPRSPGRAPPAAPLVFEHAATAADASATTRSLGLEAGAGDEEGNGAAVGAAGGKDAVPAPAAASEGPGVQAPSAEEEEEEEQDLRPALGLMVPIVPREVEKQLGAVQAEMESLVAAVASLRVRVEGLEAADALEDVRAAASQVVLEAIPGLVAQQVGVVREEMEALVAQQGGPLVELAGQAARDAAEAVLAVRESAAEAAAAREAVAEVQVVAEAAAATAREASGVAEVASREAGEAAAAAQAAAAEAAHCRQAAAEAALQAAEGVREATEAVREAAAVAAAEAAASAARSTADSEVPGQAEAASAEGIAAGASGGDLGLSAEQTEAMREVAEAVAREVAKAVVVEQVAAVRSAQEEHAAAAEALAAEVKEMRLAVSTFDGRLRDVDEMRDQLEALTSQLRDLPSAGEGTVPSSQPPSTPTAAAVASIFTPAATALVLQPPPAPAVTPRAGASPPPSSSGGGGRATPGAIAAQTSSQQAAFLARMVAAVKGYSNRLHAQYSDAEETGMALLQVDSSLDEAAVRFADVRDPNSPAFAEALVMILEQVAALRYIGSQTHPAVQQMVLEHENRLDQLTEQVKGATGAAAAAASAAVSGRLERLEGEVGRLAGQQAALDRGVTEILDAADGLRQQAAVAANAAAAAAAASSGGAAEGVAAPSEAAANAAATTLELAALAAKVRLLDESLGSQLAGLRQEILAEVAAAAAGAGIRSQIGGSGGGGISSDGAAADVAALDSRVGQLHSAWTALRNRVLAMQEYVDSTQGMIKDMHVALGGLHRRVDGLEAAALGAGAGFTSGRTSVRVSGSGASMGGVGGGAGGGMPEAANIRELQSEVSKLEMRLLTLEASSIEAAHSLAGLKGLAPRLSEAESRLTDACGKLAAALGGSPGTATSPAAIPAPGPGVSLPAMVTALRALERRVAGRLEAACLALETLTGALAAAGRIQAESTANPFKAISAAVKNPVVVALEEKMESMRSTVEAAAASLLEDLKRDQHQQQFETRTGGALEGGSVRGGGAGTPGGGGGSFSGGSTGLSFRV